MRRSILWPPKIIGGRCVLTPDPRDPASDPNVAVSQIIALSLLPGSSTHPWNRQQGLGVTDPTFAPLSAASRQGRRGDIRERFAQLERERRARLVNVVESEGDSTLIVSVTYENLETGERVDLEV